MTMHVPKRSEDSEEIILSRREIQDYRAKLAILLTEQHRAAKRIEDLETLVAILKRLLTEHGVELPGSFH